MPASTKARKVKRLSWLIGLSVFMFTALCGMRFREHLRHAHAVKPVRHVQIEINLYDDADLVIADADVEFWPGVEDWRLMEWEDKWLGKMERFERTGGCGCCNEVYTVRGPRIAILEFPPVSKGRQHLYPLWKNDADRHYAAGEQTDETEHSKRSILNP